MTISGSPAKKAGKKAKAEESTDDKSKKEKKAKVQEEKGDKTNLYNDKGEFVDYELEEKYNAYVKRKTDKKLPAKDRQQWKEAVDYWAVLREQGEKFANEKFEEFEKKNPTAKREITIEVHNPDTDETIKIRVDAIAVDPNNAERYIIQEYKSSETAPYTKNQEVGFELLYKYGGVVVGKGKPDDRGGGFVGGLVIPANTDVEVVRPSGLKYYNEELNK